MNDGIAKRLNSLEDNIKLVRRNFYAYDRSFMRGEEKIYPDIDNLAEDLVPGRFRVRVAEVDFENFLYFNEIVKPTKLFVIYSGATDRSLTLPIFRRWTYYDMVESLGGALLCIADPMLRKYQELRLGWYYGEREVSYAALSTEIVRAVGCGLGLGDEDVVFFSSSGGGSAAIYAASLMQKSLCIALNPQIYIQNYPQSASFKKLTGLDLNQHDKLHRNDLPHMMTHSRSRFCLLFNAKCEHDRLKHMGPMCEVLGIVPQYGLTARDNVLLWVYDAQGLPNPHEAQETRSLFLPICHIAMAFHEGAISSEIYEMALCVNEIWHEVYQYKELKVGVEKLDRIFPLQLMLEIQKVLEKRLPRSILELGEASECSRLLTSYASSVATEYLAIDEDKVRYFSDIVKGKRFDLLFFHCPRREDIKLLRMDISPRLPEILADVFSIFIDHAEQNEEEFFIKDIVKVLAINSVFVDKKYVLMGEVKVCVLSGKKSKVKEFTDENNNVIRIFPPLSGGGEQMFDNEEIKSCIEFHGNSSMVEIYHPIPLKNQCH